jgi:ferrochelatase
MTKDDGRMTGILLIQLGTPDAPTAKALRPYLRQFLSDRRVIEANPLVWWFVLNLFILPTRPRASAAKYARIWDPVTGSPLLHYTKLQTEALAAAFPGTPVRFGMMVGNPSVVSVVNEMIAAGVDRFVAFPMFPQYSATTSASASDALFKALKTVRCVPAVRFVPPYYAHPAYLDAVAGVVRDDLAKLPWEPEHVAVSFHGIPQAYADRGDPYAAHVVESTKGLVERMGWKREYWTQSYQSRFGKRAWLKPYTDNVLIELAKRGVKRVAVALPGFTADCLETLDEIGNESREVFLHAGGVEYRAIPCLNGDPRWVAAMATILREEGRGWLG